MSDTKNIYKLYAENTEQASPIQQTYDKFMNAHLDLMNAHAAMQELMRSDEFQFAVNSEWMGIEEDDGDIEPENIPADYETYVRTFFFEW